MKKIILVSTTGDDVSGASKALIELAIALRNKGNKVIIVLPSCGNLKQIFDRLGIPSKVLFFYETWWKWLDKEKFSYIKYCIKQIFNHRYYHRIKMYLKKEKPDIVHINALTNGGIAQCAEDLNIPVVWHIREFMEEDLGIAFANQKNALKILNKATCFLAISKAIKEKWQRKIHVPINVVYDGVPISNYLVKNKQLDTQVCRVILYGRFVPGKGQLFFLQGIHKLISDHKDINIKCYLAGRIEDRQYYQKCMNYIKSSGLENYVQYIGEINNIKELLSDKDIVSVCSKQEGFGRVTVEGMLGKCIVVAANSGASSEIIEDGKTGFLYQSNNIDNFADKMYEAIKNRTSKISENAQNYAKQQFSTQRNVDEIIKIYEKIGKNK